tara:strand:- start:741 stop:971 length:231 start_codon:yes stop_codon:yes gene_type:complete
MAKLLNFLNVLLPQTFLITTEFVEIIPRIKASIMAVIKLKLDRVIPYWLNGIYFNFALPQRQCPLARPMAANLGRW